MTRKRPTSKTLLRNGWKTRWVNLYEGGPRWKVYDHPRNPLTQGLSLHDAIGWYKAGVKGAV